MTRPRPKLVPDAWLSVSGAAKIAKCAPGTLVAAIIRLELPASCARCHRKLSQNAIYHGHLCPNAPNEAKRFPVVIRLRDLRKFSTSPSHVAAGRASAKKRGFA